MRPSAFFDLWENIPYTGAMRTQQKPHTHSLTSRFLTATRADMLAMARDLMTAAAAAERDGADIFGDPFRPLVVGVNGSHQSGKKIIADMAVETLFDDTPHMEGHAEFDEYWFGTRNGRAFEIDYIDAAWPERRSYSHRMAAGANIGAEAKIYDFLRQRRDGGVTFLQNPAEGRAYAGINLYIERRRCQEHLGYTLPRRSCAPARLRDAFAGLDAQSEWARFVEIEISDRRLLQSPAFLGAFAGFEPFCRLPKPAGWRQRVHDFMFIPQDNDMMCSKTVPVYGRTMNRGAGGLRRHDDAALCLHHR